MWITLWITRKVIHSFLCNPVDNSVIHILSTRYPQPPVDNSCSHCGRTDTESKIEHIIDKQTGFKTLVLVYISIKTAFGRSYPHIDINLWITLWIFAKTLHKTKCKYFPKRFVQCFNVLQ